VHLLQSAPAGGWPPWLTSGLGAVADAHVRLERGGLEGKIVLIPNG
jgi:hypothetical protein